MESASAEHVAGAALRGEIVIDVRTAAEYASGHVAPSIFMPLATVPLRLSELDRHTPVYVVCESGGRAHQACQYLQQHGYHAINLAGGMTSWRHAGLPVAVGAPQMA